LQVELEKILVDRMLWMANEGKTNKAIARNLRMDISEVEFVFRAFLPVDPREARTKPKKDPQPLSRKKLDRISFDEIIPGDKLRVTHVTGASGQVTSGWGSDTYGITRTAVSVAAVCVFDKVWLNADGHPVAHRDWRELNIRRLA
jgi:hypothetical protein